MRLAVVVPGPLTMRTGGYVYDRRMVDGLRTRGWCVDVCELDDTFPFPSDAARARGEAAIINQATGSLVLVDGLCLGALGGVVVHEAPRLTVVALVHLPLGADLGLDAASADGDDPADPAAVTRARESERQALAAVSRIVVTGLTGQRLLAGCGVAGDRVVVVEPGTDPAPLARGSNGSRLELLSVGTLNRTKGHADVLRALATGRGDHIDWHLTCAGSATRDAATTDRVRDLIRSLDLADRVTLAGELEPSALAACYDRADLFVLATRQETYGMAVAEALARGLPVVATRTGAIPDLVAEGTAEPAGLLVAPGDVEALGEALGRVLRDVDLRRTLTAGARSARARLPGWDGAVDQIATLLATLDRSGEIRARSDRDD